jgi:elongation factor P
MLDYNQITNRTYITLDGQPYEVLSSHIFRKQQRKAVNQTKLRNLITGNILERTFQQSDSAEKASVNTKPITFVYEKRGDYVFYDTDDKSNRFSISNEVIGDQGTFLYEGIDVTGIIYEDAVIGITLPVKVDLEVVEAPPNIKGNTSQGGTKRVTLSTGANVDTPLFIEVGDVVRVHTEKNAYVERVSKK